MMNLLKDPSRSIQFEAFHVFKVRQRGIVGCRALEACGGAGGGRQGGRGACTSRRGGGAQSAQWGSSGCTLCVSGLSL